MNEIHLEEQVPDIEFRHVWKRFSGVMDPTLADFNLKCMPGRINIVIGYSGAGKSVSLKHALGLLQPDQGEVFIKGQSVQKAHAVQLREMRKNFGMLFQSSALFDSLNVFENVAFPLREYRRDMSEEQIHAKVIDLLQMVELVGVESKMPSNLSGGMAKRVGLARAIALQPKILLCDEPTTGLDPVTTRIIHELIVKTIRTLGASALIISHDVYAALGIADDISMLYAGRILETNTPEQFVKSELPEVKQFLQCAGVL